MEILSDYGSKHVLLGESKTNYIERELDSNFNGPEGQ